LWKKSPIKITKFKQVLSKPGNKLLLQRADRLGDMILCLPAIESIKKAFPTLHITMIGSSKNSQLLKTYPLIDDYMEFNVETSTSKDKKNFIKKIKNKKYDCYIAFWTNSFFEKLAKNTGIKLSIGAITSPLSSYYYSHPVSISWNNIFFHEIDFNLSLIAPLNIPIQRTCKLYPSNKHSIKSNKPTCVIFCSSGVSNLSLSEKMIVNLIDLILKNTDFNITLTYGFIEKDSKLLTLKKNRLTNFIAPLNFDDLLDVINTANLYIGPDTGPTHMASFINIPTIVIFRNINSLPVRWGPQSNLFHITRFDYNKISNLREIKEINSICKHISSISTAPIATPVIKRLYHLKHSLRICCECNSISEFKHQKTQITHLKNNNWIIFLHIKRKNPLKNFILLYKKYKNRNINVFLCSSMSWYHFVFKLIFNSDLKPKPIFISIKKFESFCLKQINTFISKYN
jgi:ADP-heptose:LPS heptosyltransferase